MEKFIKDKPFYFLRHAPTNWNLEKRIMGHTDVPITLEAEQELKKYAPNLKKFNFSLIVTSPLKRTQVTSKIIANIINKEIIIIEELKECFWGRMQGMYRDQDNCLENWKKGMIFDEQAESYEQFLQRSTTGINKALDIADNILIVGHGGTYWAIQKHLHLENQLIENCSLIYHTPIINNKTENSWEVTNINFYKN